MLAREQRFMIREMYRKGVSISEIARRMGRDRQTLRQIVNAPELTAEKHPRQAKACKIDPYAPYLERRMAEGVLNARKLYGEILAQGYPGKESKVREFVHDRRPEKEPVGTIRFETVPGEQGQVDWGYFGFITHHGRVMRLYAFIMTLGWSRACSVQFTISSDTTWVIRCHLHAFAYLGGVPKRLLSDTLKSVVERRDAEGKVHWNPRFLDFAAVAGFSPQACQPYRPQTKGKVENGVKYVRGNALRQACIFRPWTTSPLKHWPGSTPPLTGVCMAPAERFPLHDCAPKDCRTPESAFTSETSVMPTRRSSKDCVISYEGHLYSVPAGYARKTLQVKITEAGEVVICSEVGQELARHRIRLGRRERSVQPEHDQGLGKATPRQERASAVQEPSPTTPAPFWDAPVVEVRSLAGSDQLLWEVSGTIIALSTCKLSWNASS